MKKVKLLSLGLSLALLMTGCNLRHNNEQEYPEMNYSENTDTSKEQEKPLEGPEIDAYRSFLTERLKEEQGFKVAMIGLDEDEVFEMALLRQEGTDYSVYLYGYEDGQVVDLATEGFPFYGTSADFAYLERHNCFYYEYLNAQGDAAESTEFIFTMQDGRPVLEHTVVHSTSYETEEVTYVIDDVEVTEEQYKDFNTAYLKDAYEGFRPIKENLLTAVESEDDLDIALYKKYARIYNDDRDKFPVAAKKPAIYLYPENDNETVTVTLDIDGKYTKLIPEFNLHNGWTVTANRNGDVHLDGQTYDYLFWEALLNAEFSFDEGFCVAGSDTRQFLEKALTEAGLNEKEKDQFIEFWLPQMENNEYNVISFQTSAYTDHARLHVYPKPDTTIRVYMAYYASDEYVDINEQQLSAPERTGFTVVEWGGSCLR